MAVTIRDIAQTLEITHATVSRALHDHPEIALATRERVKKQAAKMSYRPNLLARGLVKGKTQTIGFLMDSPTFEVAAARMMVLDRLASEVGYRLYVSFTAGDFERAVETANELVDRNVDGLVIRGIFPGVPAEQLQVELDFPIPTVFLEMQIPFACKQVQRDGGVGVKQAVDYLYGLGHRQIYMFRIKWKGWEKDPRFTGFYEAIAKHSLGEPKQRLYEISESGYVNKDGHKVLNLDETSLHIKEFLKARPDCTAILCSSDTAALFVLQALSRLGISVPDDISLVGFDNIPATLYSRPALSTVTIPVEKLMHAAFDLLLDGIEKDNNKPEEVVIPTEFIIRQSTGPVRSKKRIKLIMEKLTS